MKLHELIIKEAAETREVKLVSTEGSTHKAIRSNKIVMNALNDFIAKPQIEGSKSGHNCLYTDPKSGGDFEGVYFESTDSVKIDNSNSVLDAANDVVRQTGFRFLQFKKGVVIGPKS